MADFGKLNFAVSFNPQTAFLWTHGITFLPWAPLRLPPPPLLKLVVRTAFIFMVRMFAL